MPLTSTFDLLRQNSRLALRQFATAAASTLEAFGPERFPSGGGSSMMRVTLLASGKLILKTYFSSSSATTLGLASASSDDVNCPSRPSIILPEYYILCPAKRLTLNGSVRRGCHPSVIRDWVVNDPRFFLFSSVGNRLIC